MIFLRQGGSLRSVQYEVCKNQDWFKEAVFRLRVAPHNQTYTCLEKSQK